jgi:WD40 repeat protein
LWDTNHTGQVVATFTAHQKDVYALAFSPDGAQLASGSKDETVMLWDGRDGSPIDTLRYSFGGSLTSVAFSSGLLAAATNDSITIWDRKTFHPICILNHGSDSLSFSPGYLLASAHNNHVSSTSTVTLWDMGKWKPTATFKVHSSARQLIFSPDGRHLSVVPG